MHAAHGRNRTRILAMGRPGWVAAMTRHASDTSQLMALIRQWMETFTIRPMKDERSQRLAAQLENESIDASNLQ